MIRLARCLLLAQVLLLFGCVSATWDSETVTVEQPASVVREYDPALGKLIKETTTQAVTTIKRKRLNYSDTTGAGKVAGGMLEEFGGLGGVWGAMGITGQLATGGGVLGVLGMIWRGIHLAGQSRGYTQAQIEHGGVPGLKRGKANERHEA